MYSCDWFVLFDLVVSVGSKSIADYSEFWKQLSDEIARTPMEDDMKRKVRIACNDCLERSTTDFHFLGV